MTSSMLVRRAEINRRQNAARLAGNIELLQSLIFEEMTLLRSVYGKLAG